VKLELTKRGDYAIRAMIALARGDGELLSARAIAEQMAIPPRFLPQVMADLVKADLVQAVQGRSGGYHLSHPATQTTLLDVVEAAEGTSLRETCLLRGGRCGRNGYCSVHSAFAAAEEAMITALREVALADVSGGPLFGCEWSEEQQ
jgi:Rrf2 family transcriptional regulator, iron-sulfur cluster assembly transcription factor